MSIAHKKLLGVQNLKQKIKEKLITKKCAQQVVKYLKIEAKLCSTEPTSDECIINSNNVAEIQDRADHAESSHNTASSAAEVTALSTTTTEISVDISQCPSSLWSKKIDFVILQGPHNSKLADKGYPRNEKGRPFF